MLHAAGSEFGLPSAVTGQHGRWASLIRPVAGSEIARFQQHLLRLSADCRRSRFGNATSDAFVRDYGRQINHRNTLLLGLFNAGELRAAAELRSLQDNWRTEAEAAFSVERPWQSRGIGTALMAETVRHARDMAIEHIYLSCHVHNRPMQRVAEKMAAKLRFEDDECFVHLSVCCDRSPWSFTTDGAGGAPGASSSSLKSFDR